MDTRFGRQPAHSILIRERWTVPRAAKMLDVPPQHLMKALHGRIRPSVEVRTRLPLLVGVPLSELFTEDALAGTHARYVGRKLAVTS